MKKFVLMAVVAFTTLAAQAVPMMIAPGGAKGFQYYGDPSRRWTFPANNLHMFDGSTGNPAINEQVFNQIIDGVMALYQPIAKARGVTLQADKLWTDATVNASSYQQGKTWYVEMYGGLARRPEITPDGFALVVCHELGHHFGGYPFVSGWAANEGEADYYATQTCARLIWGRDQQANMGWRGLTNIPNAVATKCAQAWPNNANAQGWCVRVSAGGLSLATLLAALGKSPVPKFETPDPHVVTTTFNDHPAAQCRLDTYLAGALCTKMQDLNVIPGLNAAHGSAAAEQESEKYTCYEKDGFTYSARPRCWFKPIQDTKPLTNTFANGWR